MLSQNHSCYDATFFFFDERRTKTSCRRRRWNPVSLSSSAISDFGLWEPKNEGINPAFGSCECSLRSELKGSVELHSQCTWLREPLTLSSVFSLTSYFCFRKTHKPRDFCKRGTSDKGLEWLALINKRDRGEESRSATRDERGPGTHSTSRRGTSGRSRQIVVPVQWSKVPSPWRSRTFQKWWVCVVSWHFLSFFVMPT